MILWYTENLPTVKNDLVKPSQHAWTLQADKGPCIHQTEWFFDTNLLPSPPHPLPRKKKKKVRKKNDEKRFDPTWSD